jgi:hypothetical protein
MDFEFTSRPKTTPSWASGDGDPSTPRKRMTHYISILRTRFVFTTPSFCTIGAHNDLEPPASPFASRPPPPSFGLNQNVPFLFQTPQMPVPEPHYPWQPPPGFSPSKAFPQPEIPEVVMGEASPEAPKTKVTGASNGSANESDGMEKNEEKRMVALGGLKRVFKKRQTALTRGRRRDARDENETDEDSENEDERSMTPITQNTSNHYTLNMPGVSGQGDLPYMLLG